MTDFRILREGAMHGLKFMSDVVDTHVVENVAHVAATRTTGVLNPMFVLGHGTLSSGIFKPTFFERAASQVVRGDGASAFDDAVRALHELGARHGVDGISLSTDANLYGTIKFADSSLYMSGKPVIERIGREAAFDLDAAARRVLDFVPGLRDDMTDFTILSSAAKGVLRFADTAIETTIADDAIRTVVNIERGVANPLGKVPGLGFFPIGQGSFFNRAVQLERDIATTGAGAGSFADAVESLHNVAARHGVDGIMLNADPGVPGMLRYKGELGFGGEFPPRIDPAARLRIDRAARLVQDFVEAGT